MLGTLVLNNVGTQGFTNGTVLKLFKKEFDEFGPDFFGNRPLNDGQLPVIEPALPGLGLQWDLSLFRTNGVISVAGGGPTTPPTVTYAVTNGMLGLSWPTNYEGWQVYAQTNDLEVGLTGDWTPIPGTTAGTTYETDIIVTNPTVFYILGLPTTTP